LNRPDGLADDQWAAIQDAEERLLRAKAYRDAPLVVGSAKELCEAVARVVIAERGGVAGSGTDMPELISAAHRALEFQAGEGLANDPETRKIAQGVRSVVLGVSEMRNRRGTGHGRPAPAGTTDDHADLAFDAAYLWCTWALRRLEPYIAGDATALVRDLDKGIFRGGDVARRLTYATLPRLPVEDQMRLGVAVARRASKGTFVVSKDGIDAVQPGDTGTWPTGYVEGLLTGLFLDANGNLELAKWKVSDAARLVSELPDPVPVLLRLTARISDAASSNGVAGDESALSESITEFARTAPALANAEVRAMWVGISRTLTDAVASSRGP
jgi:hypothetical protein